MVILMLALLALPLAAEAQQQTGRVARIGVLNPGSEEAARPSRERAIFVKTLGDLGWTEGRNLTIERRFAGGKFDRLPALLAELISLKVDVIVAVSSPAAVAAKKATGDIPIVFVNVTDPVGEGLVASLARPGGNLTGVATLLQETTPKLLELLRETVPAVNRIAVVWNPASPGKLHEWRAIEAAARVPGIALRSFEVRNSEDLASAFATIQRERPGALVTFADSLTLTHRERIVEFARANRLPAIYQLAAFVQAGGLMSYGLDNNEQFNRLAVYVDRVLRGAKPGDLPIEQPTKFELVINLKTARALGLTIPPAVLARADEIVE